MFNKIFKALANPFKAFNYLMTAIKIRLNTKKDVLVIIGLDPNGELTILHPGYKICYGFEANPERFRKLKKKYSKYNNIKLYNVAVATDDGEIEFNISSNNDGASSSIGNFSEDWQKLHPFAEIKMIRKIKIPCINFYNFCIKNNIKYIDDYISDIQGMDLEVLKTLKPMLEKKQIGTIRCEVTKDEHRNIYTDLPDNSFNCFQELLNENYLLIATGAGILKDGNFNKTPQQTWEMDCKWQLK